MTEEILKSNSQIAMRLMESAEIAFKNGDREPQLYKKVTFWRMGTFKVRIEGTMGSENLIFVTNILSTLEKAYSIMENKGE